MALMEYQPGVHVLDLFPRAGVDRDFDYPADRGVDAGVAPNAFVSDEDLNWRLSAGST